MDRIAREHREEILRELRWSAYGFSVEEMAEKFGIQQSVLAPVFDDLLRTRKIVQLGRRRTPAGVLVDVFRERI